MNSVEARVIDQDFDEYNYAWDVFNATASSYLILANLLIYQACLNAGQEGVEIAEYGNDEAGS